MMSHWPCKEGHYLQNHRIPIKIRTVSQTLFVFYNFGIFEAKFHELSLGLLCPHDQIQVIIWGAGVLQMLSVHQISRQWRQCVFLLVILCVCSVTQSCPTFCNPMDYSPPGSSVHGVLQARILQWVIISSSRIFPTTPHEKPKKYNVHIYGRVWILEN